MKTLILTIICYFSLTVVGLAGNKAFYPTNIETWITNQYNVGIDYIEQNDGFDVESIDVFLEESSCTVTITGSIGISGTSISVSISVTADTCAEAITDAIDSYKEIRAMIMELL